MLRKANNPAPTAHGASVPVVSEFAGLYETRHGLFAGPRTLWADGEPAPATPPAPAPAPAPVPESGDSAVARALSGLLNRHGSSDAVALHLLNENHTLREERRTLRGQVPADGTLVLTPEQRAQWEAYQQLDADPAALRTRLADGTAATEREQARTLADASGANASVLSDRLRSAGLRAEVRDILANGTTPASRAVHVLNAEGQDQGELRAYAQQHWGDYLPSLYPSTQGQSRGTPVAAQAGASAAGAATGSNLLAQRIAAREQAAAPAVAATQGA